MQYIILFLKPTQKLSLVEEATNDETDDDLDNKPVSVKRKRLINTISSDEDEDEDNTRGKVAAFCKSFMNIHFKK